MVYITTQFKCIKMLPLKNNLKKMQSLIPNQVFPSALAGPNDQFTDRMKHEKF